MVERYRESEKIIDDVWVVIQLLMDHKGKDAHLGSTTIVQLNGHLLLNSGLVPFGSA